jgi:hypothetical protein
MEGILKVMDDHSLGAFSQFAQSEPQFNFTLTFVGMPKKSQPAPEDQAAMACVLEAVIAELDRACRSVLDS